jgi:hypothetical protein
LAQVPEGLYSEQNSVSAPGVVCYQNAKFSVCFLNPVFFEKNETPHESANLEDLLFFLSLQVLFF